MDIGAQLRTAREERGLSMEALAHTLRVKARILSAIERNDLATVPPRPFGRGVVKAYAHEVGLDPDYTAREYFARFAPATPVPPPEQQAHGSPSAGRAPIVIGASLLAVAALVGWMATRSSTDSPPAPSAGARKAASTGSPQAPSTGSPQVTSTSPTEAVTGTAGRTGSRAAASGGVAVTLTATRVCWVTVTADGRRVLYRLLQPGTREVVSASREVVILAGDAGALMWSLGESSPREAGRSGEVRTLTITPEGLRR